MSFRVVTLSVLSGISLLASGCEKVPTFKDLTGQPQNAAQPAAANPNPTASNVPPNTQVPVVVTRPVSPVDPATFISDLRRLPGRGFDDAEIATLVNLPSGLGEVKSLDFANCAVTDDGIKQLGKLPALSELSVRSTRIDGRGLEGLKSLATLRVLTLSEAYSLTPNAWDIVSELTQLETLSVKGTRITDADVAKLTKLVNLKELNLGQTGVTDAVFAHLADMENLEILRLELNSGIDGSGLQSFAKYKKKKPVLRELHAKSTRLENGLKHVKGIPSLEFLDNSDVLMNDAVFAELKGAGNLKRLDVSETRLTINSMPTMATLKNLRELDIRNIITINDACLGQLSKMRGLQSLNVTRTGCTRKGLNEFAKVHKNCKLIFIDEQP